MKQAAQGLLGGCLLLALAGCTVPVGQPQPKQTSAPVPPAGGGAGAVVEPGSVAPGVAFDAVLALPAAPHSAEPVYGPAPQQRGLFWLPAGPGPHPVVVFLHGGCWLSAYGVDHAAPLAAALQQAGYAVWAPEYRRVGDTGGGWPGTFKDVAAAVDHTRALAGDFPLDLGRVVLAGHSAGGHLALWAGARPAFPPEHPMWHSNPLPVRGVLGLAAITDLESYARGTSSCEAVTPQLLGGSPEQVPLRYQAASPLRLPAPPGSTVLVHGSADGIVPMAQAQAWMAAVGAGQGAQLRPVPAAGHFDLIHPGSAAFGQVLAALEGLLADQ